MLRRSARPAAAAATLALAAACGGYRQPPPLRPEPVPWADTLPVPEPRARGPSEAEVFLEESLVRPLVRPPSLQPRREAANLTHDDDVVSSAWFEHRNGRTPMTPAEIARGPGGRGPDTSRALTVVAGKAGGVTPGFTVRDARGDRYLFKFDAATHPLLGSAAGVIANRLFHAAGYHVPEDHVVIFDASRLVVDPAARITDGGRRRPMTRDDVDDILSRTAPRDDGLIRGLGSRFVPGVPKGPFRFNGRRADDPNDYYPHEFRRDLRGLFVVAAWLNHVDLRYGNSLDAYVEPGYLRHYLIDFASSLGSSAGRAYYTPQAGAEYRFDLGLVLARFLSLGLYSAPWERERFEIIHPSIGWMATESFRPGAWKPGWPNRALDALTPADGYWGAKLVGSFSEEQIRAAVGTGKLPREAADTLAAILVHRRDATTRYWYGQVSPLEDVSVAAGVEAGSSELAFTDLGVRAGHWPGTATVYRWVLAHPARGVRASGQSRGRPGPRQIVPLAWAPGGSREDAGGDEDGPREGAGSALPAEGDRLARLTVVAQRPGIAGRAATVYLTWEGPDRGYRIAGLRH